jgi:hypothetical protein
MFSARNYSADHVELIMHRNFVRFLRAAWAQVGLLLTALHLTALHKSSDVSSLTCGTAEPVLETYLAELRVIARNK